MSSSDNKAADWRDELPSVRLSEETLPVSGIVAEGGRVLVPAMTEEEVAASIASRGKKMVPVDIPEFTTPWQFKEVMAATYSFYMQTGSLPDPEDLVDKLPALNKTKITKIMHHPQFRRAMYIRGVDYNIGRTISPEQDMAIAIVGAPDGRPFITKLKAAGVAPSKWRAWLKQKAFREAWDNYGGSVLKEHENDMMVALVGRALEGDTNAIKYAFEVSGRHDTSKRNNIDAGQIIMAMIEIIQEEVKDPSTLQRIAARMQLVGNNTPAGNNVISDTKDFLRKQIEGADDA